MAYKKAKVFAHLESLQTPAVIITASEFHDRERERGRESDSRLTTDFFFPSLMSFLFGKF